MKTPWPWDHLALQGPIQSALERMAKAHHFPSPLLLAGPKGCAKRELAQAIASYLAPHPVDQHHFFPEGKMALHSLSTLKKLQQEVMSKPFSSKRKAVIIHDAGRMLPSGASILLKTLEEPLPTTQIIVLANEVEELLETVASRCVKLFLRPIPHSPVDETDQNGFRDRQRFGLSVIEAFRRRDYFKIDQLLKDFQKQYDQLAASDPHQAKEFAREIFEFIGYWFRDQYLSKWGSHQPLPDPLRVHKALYETSESLEANLSASQSLETLCFQLF